MKNREKYAEELLNVACTGNRIAIDKRTMQIVSCACFSCVYCLLNEYDDCSKGLEKWAESEYIERPKISKKDIPTAFDINTVMEHLEKELELADDEKSRCIKENPMQFDEAKGYARGIATAIEIVKGDIADAEDAKDTNVPGKWIPCSERLPEDESYILVSFENSTMPDIARYEENDEDGAFYPGDDEKSYSSYGFFVNAWMPLPKPHREVE